MIVFKIVRWTHDFGGVSLDISSDQTVCFFPRKRVEGSHFEVQGYSGIFNYSNMLLSFPYLYGSNPVNTRAIDGDDDQKRSLKAL